MNKINEIRLIPKETIVWSIKNQSNIRLVDDTIVQIKHTCIGNDTVFVEPRQLIFNMIGHIPTLIGRGTDEWSLNYSNTLPYNIPSPTF